MTFGKFLNKVENKLTKRIFIILCTVIIGSFFAYFINSKYLWVAVLYLVFCLALILSALHKLKV